LLTILLTANECLAEKLRDLIPGLYGGDGITLAKAPEPRNHSPHFTIDSAAAINQLNDEIVGEIAALPFGSLESGFALMFDPESGTFVRSTKSLGPLLAERPSTLGRGRFNLGVSFTYYKYNEFEGQDLDNLKVDALHQPDTLDPADKRTNFELDTVRINLDIDIDVWVLALNATYGITDRLDVGILVPLVSVEMDIKARAEIIVSPETPMRTPPIHRFGDESPDDSASDDAIGLGDIILRGKYQLLQSDVMDIAGAMLIKLETGDEDNFLGTGDTTVRPLMVAARTFNNVLGSSISFTPHLNFGFEWNLNESDESTVEYVLGFDVGNTRWVIAGEFFGSHELDRNGIGEDILATSVGAKWNPFDQFVLTANAMFPLNDEGLRSDLVTTVGVEYNF